VPAVDGHAFPVFDPADGQVLIEVAAAGSADGARALDAAAKAQPEWAATPAPERGDILRRAWELVIGRRDDFALLMTLERGKPLAESHSEVDYGAELLRWFAEEAVRINGRYLPSPSGKGRIVVTGEPVGPTLAITPWNFPPAMGTRKIAPTIIDTQSVRAASGVPKTTTGLDANNKVSGRERGLAVDVLGLIIGVVVLAASAHDNNPRRPAGH
jgi:succinate-semialdehyde dehydrogenase/glutarate-semialdehyde dehydrogenase